MVPRTLRRTLVRLARRFPIVTVTGPRQSGKTTLCRMAFPRKAYVSLEAPDVRAYATADPRGFLATYASGAILDEIQRVPDLLSYLQGEVDARPTAGRFILTGSANLALLHGVSQSLAGRTAMLTLLPLGHDEMLRFPDPPDDLFDVLWHGGYPAIFDTRPAPGDWLGSYVATYVERDVRQVLNVTDLLAFQNFLRLCAGRTAQLLNLSALAADAGITHNTARAWLSVLEASYVAFRLPALHTNVRKRLVKAPKLHFYDTGLLCYLLGILHPDQLRSHPLRGAVFETWVVSEIIKARLHRGLPASLSYYRDRAGGEIDAVLEQGDAVVAVEAKSGQTVAADFFPPLARFADSIGTRPPSGGPVVTIVAYGGDRNETRGACRVIPWNRLGDFDWAGDTARQRQ
jgi:predicted AAA+ superfamily ATPase